MIYSHPPEENNKGVQLYKHLEDVSSRITMSETHNLNVTNLEFVGKAHDSGKATSFFQAKLLKNSGKANSFGKITSFSKKKLQNNLQKKESLTYHSLFGSILYFASVMESEEDWTRSLSDSEKIASFIAINKHHSTLPNLKNLANKLTNRKIPHSDVLSEQYTDICENRHSLQLVNSILPEDVHFDSKEIERWFTEEGLKIIGGYIEKTDVDYSQVVQIYGLLTFADKSCVSGLKTEELLRNNGDQITLNVLENYISSELKPPKKLESTFSPTQKLNYYREYARKQILESLRNRNVENSELSLIQLPTGFGKTLSSLTAALYVKENSSRDNIIYSLPLTSIIDQTQSTISDIFNVKPTDPEFTIHHYLSETTSLFETTDVVDPEQAGYSPNELHASSWQSTLTLSTFVQLFETLAGPKNKQAMKLNGIQNSIIIIDEIQTLPVKWWAIISRLLETLITKYNCYVISITATHPSIYDRDYTNIDTVELIQSEVYYEFLEDNPRVKFSVLPSAQTFFKHPENAEGTSVENLVQTILNEPERNSTAIINNTIQAANETTRELIEQSNSVHLNSFLQELKNRNYERLPKDKPLVCTLTSRLTPKDRKTLLNSITHLTKKKKATIYVSATQIFEAGVDISFDRIYRDLAPGSSIVQSAGRCNRSYEGSRGDVYLYYLSLENYIPSETIYNSETLNFLRYTSNIFDGKQTASEREVILDGISNYYNTIFETEETESSYTGDQLLLEKYNQSAGKDLRNTSLINQSSQMIDILIKPETPNADKIISQKIENYEIYQLKQMFQENIISIPTTQISTLSKPKQESFFEIGPTNVDIMPQDTEVTFVICEDDSVYTDIGFDITKIDSNSSSMFAM